MNIPSKDTLSAALYAESGVSVAHCYQCGKCTAGCPQAAEMDRMPSEIMRMLQIDLPGMAEKILKSYSIWLCLSCQTCTTRCPQEVDIAHVMDFLRAKSLEKGLVHPKAKDIIKFHKSFLDSIRYTGRLYELGLVIAYKMRSFHFIKDIVLAPKMFFKGKLGLLPHTIKGKREMKNIFKRTTQQKEKHV